MRYTSAYAQTKRTASQKVARQIGIAKALVKQQPATKEQIFLNCTRENCDGYCPLFPAPYTTKKGGASHV